MKILKIFGIVVGIHVFALVLIFVNPGCSSSSKVTPVPTDTMSRTDTPMSVSVPNTAPRPSASPAISFDPNAPAVAASSSSPGRMPPTRPGSPVAVTIVAEPVLDVTPAKTYTVVKGDNLWELAKKHNIAATELAAANNLKMTTVLHPGQKLIIPGKPSSPTAAATANPAASAGRTAETVTAPVKSSGNAMKHMVRSGETLGSIARQYGVKSNDIAVANSISDPAKVRAGQELIIPGWQTPTGKSGKSAQKSDSAKQKAPTATINVEQPTPPPQSNDVPVIRVDDNPFTPAPKGN